MRPPPLRSLCRRGRCWRASPPLASLLWRCRRLPLAVAPPWPVCAAAGGCRRGLPHAWRCSTASPMRRRWARVLVIGKMEDELHQSHQMMVSDSACSTSEIDAILPSVENVLFSPLLIFLRIILQTAFSVHDAEDSLWVAVWVHCNRQDRCVLFFSNGKNRGSIET